MTKFNLKTASIAVENKSEVWSFQLSKERATMLEKLEV